MKKSLVVLALAATAATGFATSAYGQTRAEEDRWRAAQRRYDQERALYERERERYDDAVERERRYGRDYDDRYYDASRDYREGRYAERPLGSNDQVYRGSDGRYYCRRSDGTIGLVVGAGVGALLGRGIDTRGERGTGTILGATLGALLGRTVERNADVRCR